MLRAPFLRASSLLIGTIIGAGIFGIPYATAQSGYAIGLFWLVALTVLTILIKLAYAKVILSFDDNRPHQLTGYGERLFGSAGKWAATAILTIGHWSALLAYIAGMGQFLAILLGQPSWSFAASVAVFATGTALILTGLRTISELEGLISLLMIGAIGLLGLLGIDKIELANLASRFHTRPLNLFLPYGVIFGALAGWAVLPEAITILRQNKLIKHPMSDKAVTKVILAAVVTSAVVYAIFQFTVVGVSGAATSEEAISGLLPYFDTWIIKAGALFGLLAMGTSFLTLAYSLRDMFDFDFDLRPSVAVFLTTTPPFLVFLLGLRSFIAASEFTGAWVGTLSMIFIFSLYWKVKKGLT